MTKEQLLEKIEHIKDIVQTYPDDTEILGAQISECFGIFTIRINVCNNIDKIAIKNNATVVVRLLDEDDEDDALQEYSIKHANGVRTSYFERLPNEGVAEE